MTGLGYESIHACVNDCFLFWGDNNKDVHFCPVCKTSRLKDSNTPRKEVPKKVLRYFPIIPRLQRLYKSSHTAKEMIWHATGKCTEPGKMQHLVDGRAWKNFDTKYLNFAKEPRNIRLGLVADGFNPFENLSQAYSIWPMILTTYNLPPWLCFMGTECVETIDVAIGQKFNMRAMVLWTINNFLAGSSLSGWSRQEYGYPPRKFDQDQIQAQLARLPTLVKELKKVTWYVLHNCPEIDTYRSQFKSRDERRTTQNNSICSPGGKDGEMYYGEAFKDDQYILATQVKQCFYLEDMARRQPHWMVVKHVNHKKFLDGGVIVVEKDPDVILFDNSSDLPLSTSLNDLDNATLHIDGQSTEVDTPPDIIDLDEDNVIIDNEDALPHDLADFDDEDLVNVDDDDGVDVVYSSEEED
ncbi:CACTA transposable element [Tanacetum coccineum]